MEIGFALKGQTVMETHNNMYIEIISSTFSERDYPLKVDLLLSKSNATVTSPPGSEETDVYINQLEGDADSELMFTFTAGSRAMNISAQMEIQEKAEGLECFFLRLTPKDSYRHEFICNKEDIGPFCEHMFCISEPGDQGT